MDVLLFLLERTDFIRRFYTTAARPFAETRRKVEEGEAPFSEPPYTEDGEPPYLAEWAEADTSLEVLGRVCVGMLSQSLLLYFRTWERTIGVIWKEGERDKAFKKGFLRGYQLCFGELLHICWSECPADLELIEQVILARNRDQHPDHIASIHVRHTHEERKRFNKLFFLNETERNMFEDPAMANVSLFNPLIHVSQELLFKAIEEVEKLTKWLEPHMRRPP